MLTLPVKHITVSLGDAERAGATLQAAAQATPSSILYVFAERN